VGAFIFNESRQNSVLVVGLNDLALREKQVLDLDLDGKVQYFFSGLFESLEFLGHSD
jgi:hypothetical protein